MHLAIHEPQHMSALCSMVNYHKKRKSSGADYLDDSPTKSSSAMGCSVCNTVFIPQCDVLYLWHNKFDLQRFHNVCKCYQTFHNVLLQMEMLQNL